MQKIVKNSNSDNVMAIQYDINKKEIQKEADF